MFSGLSLEISQFIGGTPAEKRMQDMLIDAMRDADSPEGQFERLGLK